jgi:hypothetical protein
MRHGLTVAATWLADIGFLLVTACSIVGAVASTYHILTAWRQGWMLW